MKNNRQKCYKISSTELQYKNVFDSLGYDNKRLNKDEYKNYEIYFSSITCYLAEKAIYEGDNIYEECKSSSYHRSVLDMNELFTSLVFNVIKENIHSKENIFIAVIILSLEKGLIWSW